MPKQVVLLVMDSFLAASVGVDGWVGSDSGGVGGGMGPGASSFLPTQALTALEPASLLNGLGYMDCSL